jgi:hypothetical protein
MKRRLTVAAACVVALGVLPVGGAPSRAAGVILSSYGGDASATSVHVLGATNALSNFRTGVIDNSFPLAASHLDAAPASQGTATVADTGPAGGLVVSQAPTVIQQPQYAIARFPGEATAAVNQGVSVAESTADETSAQAHAALAAVGGGGLDEATSHVSVDRAAGRVEATSAGHVAAASFGDTALVIAGLDVRASILVVGDKVTPRYTISLASASVAGIPVAITEKGVVAADPLPGSDAIAQAINVQVNEVLAAAGIELFLTPPVVAVQGAQATVEVSGVHVRFTAPAVDPSVPTLTLEYVLGEARAFAFTVPGSTLDDATTVEPVVDAVSTGVDVGAVNGPISSLAPSVGTVTLQPVTPSVVDPGTVNAVPVAIRRARPTWLVPVYLVWQALMLATAGVLVWSRGGRHG